MKAGNVVYEVNIEVERDYAEAYREWLQRHIDEILRLDGFVSAVVFVPDDAGVPVVEGRVQITALYTLESKEHLQDYFVHHAARMRAEGLRRFGEYMTATRRVLVAQQVFTADEVRASASATHE